jgi:hypothetical protein
LLAVLFVLALELIRASNKIEPRIITISKTYTKKDSPEYFKKLIEYAHKNKICLAFGGVAWKNTLQRKSWMNKRCVRYFESLKLFEEYLKRKATSI